MCDIGMEELVTEGFHNRELGKPRSLKGIHVNKIYEVPLFES